MTNMNKLHDFLTEAEQTELLKDACDCKWDTSGELLPTGCKVHSEPIENYREQRNRVCPGWVEWVVIVGSLAILGWFVARPAVLLAWAVWG